MWAARIAEWWGRVCREERKEVNDRKERIGETPGERISRRPSDGRTLHRRTTRTIEQGFALSDIGYPARE